MTCEYCKKNKLGKPHGKTSWHLHKEIPLYDLSSDIYGPFDGSLFMHSLEANEMFSICITDRATRLPKIRFSNRITSEELIHFFEFEWLSVLKNPDTLLTDQGKCYKSEKTNLFCKKHKIKQIFSFVYNPTGNSINERLNQTISTVLRIYKGWDLEVIKKVIENRMNQSYHSI